MMGTGLADHSCAKLCALFVRCVSSDPLRLADLADTTQCGAYRGRVVDIWRCAPRARPQPGGSSWPDADRCNHVTHHTSDALYARSRSLKTISSITLSHQTGSLGFQVYVMPMVSLGIPGNEVSSR